jgi:hypothetical protein
MKGIKRTAATGPLSLFNKRSVSATVVLCGLLTLGFIVLGSRARAEWHEPKGLTGTWRLELTPAYCPGVTTGTLAKPFQGLASFTSDGTLTNTFNNALFGYATPGHGYWRKAEDGTYKDVFELLLVDPPAPYVSGTQKGMATITPVNESSFTAQVVATYFDSSGTPYLTKCNDVAATRLNDSPTEP